MRVFEQGVAVFSHERRESLLRVEANGVDAGTRREEVDPARLVVGDEAALVRYGEGGVAHLRRFGGFFGGCHV